MLIARKRGVQAYLGHLDKRPVCESLKVKKAECVSVTVDSLLNNKIICQAVLNYDPSAQVIVKISSLAEKQSLHGIGIADFVHAYQETARLLVKSSLSHRRAKGPVPESE